MILDASLLDSDGWTASSARLKLLNFGQFLKIFKEY